MSYSIILRDITDDQIVGYLDIEDILSISIDPASYSSVDFHKQEARRCKIDCIVNGWDSVNTAYSVNTALFQHSINRDYYVRDWVNKDEYDWNYWNDPASAYQINIYSLDERKIITDVPIGRH